MSKSPSATAFTNTKPNSCVVVQCGCETMWSFVQEACYLRMCTATGDFKSELVKNYEVRARRIAGTYARLYLEQEKYSDPKMKGRFYWMALGAFASKTVACTLESWQVKYTAKAIATMKEGLGKGNFWLFCDIAGWHFYYTRFNDSFGQCLDKRDALTLVDEVIKQTNVMPWHAEALPKIKNLNVSKEIKAAFEKVREFESLTNKNLRPRTQMDHLMLVAQHEQGVILQPLIYDDPAFAAGVQLQRVANSSLSPVEYVNPTWLVLRKTGQALTPDLELVFSSACNTDDLKLKSVAPEDTKLEDLGSRMKWISKAAQQFHNLMLFKTTYMEGELATIAGWYDMPDKK